MPFKSKAQRSYLYANHPNIAKKWTKKHGAAIQKSAGSKLIKKPKRRTK
jgi:hypothetical protein